MGNVFGLGFLCLCWYYYTVFKFQGAIIWMMPSDSTLIDDLYKGFLLGFLGVFVGHLFLMFGQTSVDVFMIDWENRHELFRGAETVKVLMLQILISTAAWNHWSPILSITCSCWIPHAGSNQYMASSVCWKSVRTSPKCALDQLWIHVCILSSNRNDTWLCRCFAVLVLLTGLPSMTRNYYSASCITADGDDLDGCSAWAKSDFMRFAIFSFFWIAVEFCQVKNNLFLFHVQIPHGCLESTQPTWVLEKQLISLWYVICF